MRLIPLKTPRILPHQDLLPILHDALEAAKQRLEEKDILIVTSKIVAFAQGRVLTIKSKEDFRALVKKEADQMLDEGMMVLTMKNKILIPNAGVDQSNLPEGQAVLWPEDPFGWARAFRQKLMEDYKIKHLGVIVSDSMVHPVRKGTAGVALGWAGFQGVQDERGAQDLFGQKMAYTQIAVADNLASASILEAGETDASVPMVIARQVKANFCEDEFSEADYFMDPKDCLYGPLLNLIK